MKTKLTCDEIRSDLSALLDGELPEEQRRAVEAHVASCDACRARLDKLSSTRRVLRARPAEAVPDLSHRIVAAVRAESKVIASERRVRLRIAAVAAVVAALVVATSLPGSKTPTRIAEASEIAAQLRRAARDLTSYQANYKIVEYDPASEPRALSASVWYRAPESLRIEVKPHGDGGGQDESLLVANQRAWALREPGSTRTVLHRLPFDGSIALPTDVVMPLDTLADTTAFRVVGTATVAGRDSYHLSLPYRRAVPLVASLEPGGDQRAFHPSDVVDLWLDRATWFPLAFDVRAGFSEDRALWAQRQGLPDEPGALLLNVRALEFSQPATLDPAIFRVPQEGVVSDSAFRAIGSDAVGPDAIPDDTLGLQPYRAGAAGGIRVASYSDGMSWLKVTRSRTGAAPSILKDAPEEVRLSDGRWAYYLPASDTNGRRSALLHAGQTVVVESNLPRADVLTATESIAFGGDRAPAAVERSHSQATRYLGGGGVDIRWSLHPTRLPVGYTRSASVVTRTSESRTVTTYYRRTESEFASSGIKITQSDASAGLLPSAEPAVPVHLRGVDGRWSPDPGRLEWVEGTVYRSVTVPSLDLSTATAIAKSLE